LTLQRLDSAPLIRKDIERVPGALLGAARTISSATLHEAAGRTGALPSAIKPVSPGFRLCGPAVTVHAPGGDNLWIHRALYAAQPGDVLVVSVSGAYDHGYWGEVMSTAAKSVGLQGLIIDGCVRDIAMLEEIGFPVFARGLCIRGTGKDFGARGWVNFPTRFDDVVVQPGDLIVGDRDGVVAIPRSAGAQVVEKAVQRDILEADICQRIARGESTLDIYGWQVP
jgi:4-hydroxy-4-methyl-2-oxoglutarate aldolase